MSDLKLTRRSLLASPLLVALAGCAKFPANGVGGQFTQLTFRITMAGPINPSYLYFVMIATSPLPNPILVENGPQPVFGTGSANGYFTGQTNYYVQLNPLSGAQLYTVYQVGSPTDPGNNNIPVAYPINVINPQPTPPNVDWSTQWGFTISTRDIAGSDSEATAMQSITFNILTMNKTTLAGVNGRMIDALGNTAVGDSAPVRLLTTTSQTLQNTQTADPEQPNDLYSVPTGTYDPALDIVDYSVQVSVQ